MKLGIHKGIEGSGIVMGVQLDISIGSSSIVGKLESYWFLQAKTLSTKYTAVGIILLERLIVVI